MPAGVVAAGKGGGGIGERAPPLRRRMFTCWVGSRVVSVTITVTGRRCLTAGHGFRTEQPRVSLYRRDLAWAVRRLWQLRLAELMGVCGAGQLRGWPAQ